MADFGTRGLSLVTPSVAPETISPSGLVLPTDPPVADVVTLQRRASATVTGISEDEFFQDTIAEYVWARDVAGLAESTLNRLMKPVLELCTFYDLPPWRITTRMFDAYFAGEGKRKESTNRQKTLAVDGYFTFLEQRYAGEIARRFGVAVESPVDSFNRPVHRGDFGLRIPPSKQATAEFFQLWRADLQNARKYAVAVRDYVMAKLTYLSAVRAAELCGVRIGDVHWDQGQWGRFIVNGKGARRSGPRQREAYLFEDGRALLWWYMEEIRGEFFDDPTDPTAPLFPSERLPRGVAALNLPVAPQMSPDTFRRKLKAASFAYLPGPVEYVFPHLLRHACATHHYEDGMPLWDVQKILGHRWASTTVGYLTSVKADPEKTSLESSRRAVRRLSGEA